jgi:hypothetical protein
VTTPFDDTIAPSYQRVNPANLIFLAQTLSAKNLNLEPELCNSRFIGHTGDPHSLNFQMAVACNKIYAMKFRENIDYRGSHNVRSVDLRMFMIGNTAQDKSGIYQAVNSLRQVADKTGWPYERFVNFCFDFALKRGKPKFLPQPNQLVPSSGSKFEMAFYRVLGEALESEKGLHEKRHLMRFKQSPEIEMKSCIGLSLCRDENSPHCQQCPMARKCHQICALIEPHLEKLKVRAGVSILRDDKLKAAAAARKRKSREKLKNAALKSKMFHPITVTAMVSAGHFS